MAFFDWRLAGADTLAYSLLEAEAAALLEPGFALAADETLALFNELGLVETLAGSAPAGGTGFTALGSLMDRGAAFKAVFLRKGPAEVVRHSALADGFGNPVRAALKLRFEVVPARALDFMALSGGGPAVSSGMVEEGLADAVEAALASRVVALDAAALGADAALQEALRGEVVERVKAFAAARGVKIGGLGLAWGFDPERMERMAAAAARQEEAGAAAKAALADGLALREARLSEAEEAAKVAKIAKETAKFAQSDEFLSFSSPMELADSVAVSFALPDPETVAPPPGDAPLMDAEPLETFDRTAEGCSPKVDLLGGDTLAAPLEAGGDNEHYSEPPPVEVCNLVKGEEVCAPRLTLAERMKTAPGFKPYGEETVACFVEEAEIPRLFRKDFSLAEDETILLLRAGRCEDFVTFGTERTSGAMGWISRLFNSGRELTVIFARLGPFELVVDIEGVDAARDGVFGAVSLKTGLKPQNGAGLAGLLAEKRALSVHDLAARVKGALQFTLNTLLQGERPKASGFGAIERSLAEEARRELGKFGMETFDVSFEWATDEEAFARLDVEFKRRSEAEWCFGVGRGAFDTRRRIELASRKVESLSALMQLPPTVKPEVGNMLARAGFGPVAVKGAKKSNADIEEAMRKVKIEITALTDELAMLVETGDAEYRHGQPPIEERRLSGLPAEDEGFLGEELGDAGWDEVLAHDAFGGTPATLTLAPLNASEGGAGGNGSDGILKIGGGGAKSGNVSNRCPHCMAPLKRDAEACGNCGRRL